jgi:hypothetical protein
MASTYLSRTNTSPTSAYKCTFSAWIKRSNLGSRQRLMTVINPSSTGAYYFVEFTSGDNLGVNDYDGVSSGGIGGSTNRKFRDTNAWYHIVVAYDTTQSTGTNRIKVYVNGVEEDTFNFDGTGSQNRTLSASVSGKTQFIGYHGTSSMYWNGSMSHVHFVDGTAYDASAFGETDATTGEWKIKTSPSVTYGTNGFFILKDGNSVTDQSGNGNNCTVAGGTLTNTEDCPSNVFNTLSPIDKPVNSSGSGASIPDLSNGNLTITNTNSAFREVRSNFYVSTGKYYFEAKPTRIDGSGAFQVGVVARNYSQGSGERRAYQNNGNKYVSNSSSYGATFTANDIIGVALNLDDGEITFYKNGVSQGVAATDMLSGIDDTGWTPAINCYDADGHLNFGNGYFGSTQISSAGTNASGIGIFEYDVPTGYTALSTKGLNL